MPLLLTDVDLRAALDPHDAVRWMGEALTQHHHNELIAPARVSADVGNGRLVFTAGRGPQWYGYRSYGAGGLADDHQVVVVHDARTGAVVAVAVGSELGPRRTGAIGGVSARHLTPDRPLRIGLIGTGLQAYSQLWAHTAAVDIADVRVYSRSEDRRQAFADTVARELGITCADVESAQDAVTDTDIVILATSSRTPVIDSAWLPTDVLVITLGPKQVGRAEFPVDLLAGADLLVTDSAAQLRGYEPPALADTLESRPVVELGAVISGSTPTPKVGRRVFLSVGLAGTEVHLLGRLSATVSHSPARSPRRSAPC